MSANRPKWWQWLLKMDAFGNYPKWWQWFFPRYGNWGAPGWSCGRWCHNPVDTDWNAPARDDMDAAFRDHDRDYQGGELFVMADLCLVAGLHRIGPPPTLFGRMYRLAAIVVFSVHVFWMMLSGRWSYLERLEKGESQ